MKIEIINADLAICKVQDFSKVNFMDRYFFIGKTDEENSLVCSEECVPSNATAVDRGWKAFRVYGTMEFSLVGILSKISEILADNRIGIFAVSTYNTDYVLTKKENFDRAVQVLSENGINLHE